VAGGALAAAGVTMWLLAPSVRVAPAAARGTLGLSIASRW